MITFDKNGNSAVSWFWKKIESGEFVTFNVPEDSCMKIFDSNDNEIERLSMGYEPNRLIFDGDDQLNIHVVATISDFSNLPSGMYRYEINVKSLVDSLKVEDSGEMEVINE